MRNKKWFILVGLVLVITLVATITFSFINPEEISAMEAEAKHSYEQADYEKSIELFSKILKQEPDHVNARIYLAKSYVALSQFDNAEQTLTEGIERLQDESAFYLELFDVYLTQRKIEEAYVTLQTGLSHANSEALEYELKQFVNRIDIVAERTFIQVDHLQSYQLAWIDEYDEIYPLQASWKLSDEAIAKIEDEDDLMIHVFATDVGEFELSAHFQDLEKAITLQSEKQVVQELSLNLDLLELPALAIGETLELEVNARDFNGEVMDFTPLWSTVNGLGTFSAPNERSTLFKTDHEGLETLRITVQDYVYEEEIVIDGENKTVRTSVEGEGEVKITPHLPSYEVGTEVTIEAIAKPGWTFVGWQGDLEGSNPVELLTVTDHHNVTAVFTTDEAGIIISKIGNGTVYSSIHFTNIQLNDLVTLTATPDSGWEFVRWTGNFIGEASDESTLQLNVDQMYHITAEFTQVGAEEEPDTDEITDTQPEHSTPNNNSNDQDGSNTGTSNGSNSSGNNNSGDQNNPPTDTRKTYTLSVNAAEGGKVLRGSPGNQFTEGTQVALTAEANDGWTFAGWSGDSRSKNATIYLTMNQNFSVKANFNKVETEPEEEPEPPAKIKYQLKTSQVGEGTVSPLPGQYEEGSTIQVQAQPASGWRFVRWQGDLTSTNAQTTITMNGNRTIQAVFERSDHSHDHSDNSDMENEG
ncbi:InlB B-repeat-containing protein [Alkalihalobacillus pseudalcaliphilus]|uniref:InlB B-repeat-containing protein n=1 Tax=Alkalihalobacillus pseudalcaliphilus TaxID=79884 RepID=UPI00064D80EF|nr:tetratricopeptide repeat protein [Alkalihalobacillus pseudalcaliphilus]KMK77398.1 hypothetical protein AB990_02675 [Alkalihalobacillus pseudalcaliphilus]